LSYEDTLTPGVYHWEQFNENNAGVLGASFSADPELLQSTTGYDYLYVISGTVTITENSEQYLSGSFDLLDENGVVITGSFVWDKNW